MVLNLTFWKPRWRRSVLALIMIFFIMFNIAATPKRAEAFAPAIVAGGVEIGALTIWGGAVAAAAVGTAVGLDPVAMQSLGDWGKRVWSGANDAIKNSITVSTAAFDALFNTTNRATLGFYSDAGSYLKQMYSDLVYHVNTSTQTIDQIIDTSTFSCAKCSYNAIDPTNNNADLGYTGTAGTSGMSVYYWVSIDDYGVATLGYRQPYASTGTATLNYKLDPTQFGTFMNPVLAWKAWIAYKGGMKSDANTISAGSIQLNIGTTSLKTLSPFTYGPAIPDVMNLPAPRGTVLPDNTVGEYTWPTAGRVGRTTTGDVAVGYPTVPGDIGGLTTGDTVANPPVVGTVPTTGDVPTTGTVDNPTVVTGDVNVPILGDIWDWLKTCWDAVLNFFGTVTGFLTGFWDAFLQFLRDMFIPTAINTAVISNVWADRFPAVDRIKSDIKSIYGYNPRGASPPVWTVTVFGKTQVAIDTSQWSSWFLTNARMYMRIIIWSMFVLGVLRDLRPKPTLG